MTTMQINREEIIKKIKEDTEQDPDVFAFWLEGSDGLNSEDEYSDLDFVFDVADGKEKGIMASIEQSLKSLGELDLNFECPQPEAKIWYKVFHIKNSSEHLLIDVNIQSHSRDFYFNENDKYEVPKIIFDKDNVIKFKRSEAIKISEVDLIRLKSVFFQRSKVAKYIARGKYLEALAYYNKYVIEPIVELVRMNYTPKISYYYLIHFSDQLPKEVVTEIEGLCKNSSLLDIEKNLIKSEQIFEKYFNLLK